MRAVVSDSWCANIRGAERGDWGEQAAGQFRSEQCQTGTTVTSTRHRVLPNGYRTTG